MIESRASNGVAEAVVTRPPATRHLFFALAAFAVLMGSIDSTIVAVAIPHLTTALDAPLIWVGWTLTAYQLVQVVMLPLAGKLSDSLGRRRVFMFCVATFTLGSLLCGLAPSIGFLIGARALQAIGGGGPRRAACSPASCRSAGCSARTWAASSCSIGPGGTCSS